MVAVRDYWSHDCKCMCINRWSELREIAEKKKEGLQLAHDVNTFHIECQETAVQRILSLTV